MIKRCSPEPIPAPPPPVVEDSALTALFSTSLGELGAFIGSSSAASSSSSAAPRKPAPVSGPPIAEVERAGLEEAKEVVINVFDDLANFEAIASAQGVTE